MTDDRRFTNTGEIEQRLSAYCTPDGSGFRVAVSAVAEDLIVLMKVSGVSREDFLRGWADAWDGTEVDIETEGSA